MEKVRIRIKKGAFISHDFGYFRWPKCKNKTKIDYEFDATWLGSFWDCVRPGFGELGNYGNGSIFVFGKGDVQPID